MFKWFNRDKLGRKRRHKKHNSMDEYDYEFDSSTSDSHIRTPEYKQALADFYARRSIGPSPSPLNNTRLSLPLSLQHQHSPKSERRKDGPPQIRLVFDNRVIMKPDVLPVQMSWDDNNNEDDTSSPPCIFHHKDNSLPFTPETTRDRELCYRPSQQIINGKEITCICGVPLINAEDITESEHITAMWSSGLYGTKTNITIKNITQTKDAKKMTYRDLEMHSVIRHSSILLLMGVVCVDDSIIKFIYEPGLMTLDQYNISRNEEESPVNYMSYMYDISNGVLYLNKMGYLHTTISSYNIVITNKHCAKLTSLHLCSAITNSSISSPQYVNMNSFRKYLNENANNSIKCTGQNICDRKHCLFNDFRFNAPELFDCVNGVVYPHITTDVYSICMVLLHCFTGEVPFEKYDFKELSDMYILWQNSVRLPDDDSFPKIVNYICSQGLSIKPEKRINIEQLSELLKNAQDTIELTRKEKSASEEDKVIVNEELGSSDKCNNNQNSMNNTDSTEYCPLLTPQVKRYLSRSNFTDSKFRSTFLFNETNEFSMSGKSDKVFRLNLSITPKSAKSFHVETSPREIFEIKNNSLPIKRALKSNEYKEKISSNLIREEQNFLSLPSDLSRSVAHDNDPYTSLDFHTKLSLFNNNFRSKKYSEERSKSEECINTGVNINSLVAKHEKWISQNNEHNSSAFTLPTYYRGIKPASHHHRILSSTPKHNTKASQIQNHILKQTFEEINKTQSTQDSVIKPSSIRQHLKTTCGRMEDMYIDDEFPANTTELSPNMQLVPLHKKHTTDCQQGNKCCIQHIQHLTHADNVYIVCQSNTTGTNVSAPLSKIEENIVDEIQNIVMNLSDDVVHI